MSDTPMKLVVDLAAGTHEYVPLTAEEIEQKEADAIAFEAERAAKEAAAEAEADAALAGKAKLQALGLTGEEIAALIK